MASWKTVEVVGWNPRRKGWTIFVEMQNPKSGMYSSTKYMYYYVGSVVYESYEANSGQMHIRTDSPLSSYFTFYKDPPAGTRVTINLYEFCKTGGKTKVDSKTIVIPSEKGTCESYKDETKCTHCGCYWYDGACHSEKKKKCTDITNKEECEANGCYWYEILCHKEKKKECPDFTNEKECKANRCYWYDGKCHKEKKKCSDLTNKEECEANGCYWYDGKCQKEEQTECYRGVIIHKSPYPPDHKYNIWTRYVGGGPYEAYRSLASCKRHIDRMIDDFGHGPYTQCRIECTEGDKRSIVMCDDNVHMASWEECVNGEWISKTGVCPCIEYSTVCNGFNLMECINGEWVLKESNSKECGYTGNGNGIPISCPIACVCNGTPLIDQLGPIREFRDKYLSKWFIDIYYGWLGKNIVRILKKSECLKKIGRVIVKGMLWRLKK